MTRKLRKGFTTGSCAAAAARGAALMLLKQEIIEEAEITLPTGDKVIFKLYGQNFNTDYASCFVVKDAGDDPDITNGAEIHASVEFGDSEKIEILGGKGVGIVTKPGLAVPPGKPAINPVPLQMIEKAVTAAPLPPDNSLRITISVPDGEERAKKTLNARLGIIGGLSILGTTGIVQPLSAKAWTDTIDSGISVAKGCKSPNIILSTGRSSEKGAFSFICTKQSFPEDGLIMMGDHISHAIKSASAAGYNTPLVACQFAKLLKIACGYENTHAAASELDLQQLAGWLDEARFSIEVTNRASTANTAREFIIASNFDTEIINLVCRHAANACRKHSADSSPEFLLIGYDGVTVYHLRQLTHETSSMSDSHAD